MLTSNAHDTTEWFKIKTEVKQGCNIPGLLFLLVVNWVMTGALHGDGLLVMRNTLQDGNTGIIWKFTTKLEDLRSHHEERTK